ncbi:MAG: hypothetical protein AAGD13_07095 [Pseudomonadota bacterium]
MCCNLLRIDSLRKPAGKWCDHCSTRTGCDIHGSHPDECRNFHCGWLTVDALGEEWKPSKSRIIMTAELGGQRITAVVDPTRPGAWRKSPYYDQLKAWAHAAVQYNGQVVVRLGERYWVILPDRDVDIGIVQSDELIITEITRDGSGTRLNALKIHKDDPRVAHLA